MTTIADDALADLVEGYLDNSLNEAGARKLAALLQSDDDTARRIRAALATTGFISLSYDTVSDDDLARSVDEQINADAHYSDLLHAITAAIIPPPSWARTWIPRGGLVAALLLVIFGLLWPYAVPRSNHLSRTAILKQQTPPGTLAVLTAPGQPDRGIAAGERVSVPKGSESELMMFDEPTVCMLAGADCVLVHGSPGIALRLQSGTITATVAHQPADVHFTIATSQAVMTVIGTRFTTTADAVRTRLHVLQGIVSFQDRQGGTTAVAAGETVESLPLPEKPWTAPVTVLPSADAWSPLFPDGSLSAWRQQHGAWRSEQGTILGEDAGGGPSRILSTRNLGDFAMTCRIRILQVNWAEIQLLGYNVFVPVAPSEPGTWQDLAVQVRAGQVNATCNGQAVAVRPGLDLGAVRFGTLSFYVRPGGRLEIRDAQFCENPDRPIPPAMRHP